MQVTSSTELNHEPIEVLMVDDRPDNLLALEATLSDEGYRLIKARSGDEALRYLLTHNPALILMDVQMPGLDGFETARIIKQSERSRDIPIIFITAINKEERYIHAGYRSGAVDYISKPFDPEVLRSKVAVFADLFRKTQKLVTQEKLLRAAELRETERKLAQLELRSLRREHTEHQKYVSLVEGIEHGIVWAANPSTLAVHYVSPAAERILLYPVTQWKLENTFLLKHIHEDDRSLFRKALNQIRKTEKSTRLEHRFVRADGSICWLSTWISLTHTDEDQSEELRGLSVDITVLKNTEKELYRSREEADFLASAGLILSQSLDPAVTLSRLEEMAVPRLANWLLISKDDPELNSSEIRHVTPGREPSASALLQLLDRHMDRSSNGDSTLVLTSEKERPGFCADLQSAGIHSLISAPLLSRSAIKGRMFFVRNESAFSPSEVKLAEDLALRVALAIDNSDLYSQSQAAITLRDEFFSIASHELKTPLTPIKLQLQQLLRMIDQHGIANVSEEKIRKALNSSNRQVGKLAKLVDELLDVSRIRMGKLSLDPADFDLSELISEVTERFADEADHANCNFDLRVSGPLPVRLDRFRIEQVIVNLVTNAIKYAPGGKITVEAKELGDQISVTVEDQGIGIAPADQKRIFERFERAVPSMNYSGLGLGLFIVAEILRAQGGQIRVESEVGSGSRFTILLPRAEVSGITALTANQETNEADSRVQLH